MSDRRMPTRASVITDVIAFTREHVGLPSRGHMGPRTFALLAMDYPARAGQPDTPLWAAGVAITPRIGMTEGVLELLPTVGGPMTFTDYRDAPWP